MADKQKYADNPKSAPPNALVLVILIAISLGLSLVLSPPDPATFLIFSFAFIALACVAYFLGYSRGRKQTND
jgi:hypothetical protein